MWRKLQAKDIRRGVAVRISMMRDTPFNGATIMSVSESMDAFKNKEIRFILARPYAYAPENGTGPLLGCEVFEVMFRENGFTDLEVYEGRNGRLVEMITGPRTFSTNQKWRTEVPPENCDFCVSQLTTMFVDGKTRMGPWAYMCEPCYKKNGVGLGEGKGYLYRIGPTGDWLNIVVD